MWLKLIPVNAIAKQLIIIILMPILGKIIRSVIKLILEKRSRKR
jgi:hypothetical protein